MAGADDPAHAGRAPDGRRRPDRHPPAERQGGRLPDRPRHGHVLLRAPVGRARWRWARYAHRPIFHHPDDIPSNEESALSPTELPFTADDFDQQFEEAIELMGTSSATAEIRYAINGLLSLTPDAMPVLGETVEVRNLWSRRRGVDQGRPRHRPARRRVDDVRLPAPVRPAQQRHQPLLPARATEHHILARCAEHFNKTYGIVHPREQWASRAGHAAQPVLRPRGGAGRGVLRRPRLGAPAVVRVQRRALRQVPAGERAPRRTSGTPGGGRRSPTPSTCRCATASAWSTSRRSTSSTSTGPGALAGLQHIRVNNVDVAVGRSVYTPLLTARRRVPRRPHDPAPRRRALPRRSPAPSTVGATSTGSAGTCRPTAR